ncbi:MAG: hypothetical protein AMJ56_01345 [Anaerolineae bacterium SG8_19]|nr:MAG: hypothetical protein AMJ56_01345 [Anaerolineae bacterium SG8_19]
MSGADEILTLLESWQDDLLEFACRLIATPSPTPPGDERQVVRVLVDHLRELGLNDINIAAMKPERPNVICRIGSQEKSSPTLILNGHIDTKPVGNTADQWDTDPLEPTIRDGRLYGLGATDMKGAVAAFVYAGAAIARAFPDLPGELLLVFSADEEGGSTYGGKYLAHDYGLRADAAIVCEPTGITRPWEFIAPVARGISCFKIKVKGTQMHSSLSDQLPSINASVKMAGVLERMSRELEIQAPPHPLCPDGITVNLGVMLHGGVTYGVYPGYAEFAVDVRTIPGMTQAGVERDVEAFLDKLRKEDPQLDVQLAFEPLPVGWTPPCEVPADAPVVRAAQAAAGQVLGTVPPLRALPAVTDGAHFAAVGIDTIPAFGPGLLPLAHSANEYIDVENLGQAAQIYALTALNFFKDTRWQKPKD